MSGVALGHISGPARWLTQSRAGWRLTCCALLLTLASIGSAAAESSLGDRVSQRPLLRVVTGYASPFVKPPGTPVSGYSVEVWHEVARRLGVDTAWTVLPDLSDEAQLAAV